MFEQTITPEAREEISRVAKLIQEKNDAFAISPVSAEFLHALTLATGVRRGVEIGTSYGYSGLWIGSALQHNGGMLTTIDQTPHKVTAARASFERAGLANTITIREGVAGDVIETLDGPFDFVFVDADKVNSQRYFDLLWPKLAQRATIVTDNITSHAGEMSEYAAYLRNHPRLCSTLVPIGSGMELTVKLDPFTSSTSIDGADWVI